MGTPPSQHGPGTTLTQVSHCCVRVPCVPSPCAVRPAVTVILWEGKLRLSFPCALRLTGLGALTTTWQSRGLAPQFALCAAQPLSFLSLGVNPQGRWVAVLQGCRDGSLLGPSQRVTEELRTVTAQASHDQTVDQVPHGKSDVSLQPTCMQACVWTRVPNHALK